jgi:hypothetical protein
MKFLERLTLIVALSILGACATAPVDYPKTPSTALEDTQDTFYGKRVAALTSAHPGGGSGFYVLGESYVQIWCMPMKLSGDLVRLFDLFSVNEFHAFNDLRQVREAA